MAVDARRPEIHNKNCTSERSRQLPPSSSPGTCQMRKMTGELLDGLIKHAGRWRVAPTFFFFLDPFLLPKLNKVKFGPRVPVLSLDTMHCRQNWQDQWNEFTLDRACADESRFIRQNCGISAFLGGADNPLRRKQDDSRGGTGKRSAGRGFQDLKEWTGLKFGL